jgi:hypothetical protein
MMKLLTTAAVLGFVTAAHAQTTFYIVQDTTTKRCTVVREKPTTKTTVIVGPAGTVYKTETEAQTAMKKIKVCVAD